MSAPPAVGRVSRRLSPEREVRLSATDFGQPFDIDLDLPPSGRRPMPALAGYHTLGLAAAADKICGVAESGLSVAVLRFVGATTDRAASLVRQAEAIQWLRAQVGNGGPSFLVDPFALALNPDLSWGVRDVDGRLHAERTEHLVATIAGTLGEVVDGLFTLGRLESEVEVTRRELDRIRPGVKIFSFSQNSETSTAYVYLDADGHDTGQKILPGNHTEMTLRALADVWDGTDVCVVKPMENFHLTYQLAELLDSPERRRAFLGDERVLRLAGLSSQTQAKVDAMRADPLSMASRCAGVRVGGYTVSGTSYTLSLLQAARGPALARARLEEMWVNAAAASGRRRGPLIDRNALPFFQGDVLS